MSTNAYYRTALTGGAATALDGIDGDLLNDGDFALVMVSGDFYVYKLDATSGASESSPYIISPDTNAGTKRFIQQSVPWVSSTGEMFLQSQLVKDPQRMVWCVASESDCGIPYGGAGAGYERIGVSLWTAAATWTRLAAVGDVSQVVADDTYATITNVTSGGGVLTNLVLPGVTSASDVVSVKITVDGTEYELEFTADNATDRFFTGPTFHFGDATYSSSGSYPGDMYGCDLVSGLAFRKLSTADFAMAIYGPDWCLANAPCVRFETSLKVEMKSSDFTTTDNRDDCAVIYVLDQY